MGYRHTQRAPLYLLLLGPGILILIAALAAPPRAVQVILLCSGALMLVAAAAFRHLTVSDEGQFLLVEFGPLPLFRRRIEYADIEQVKRTRSTFLDGWGIHLSPSGGWTWNLWGFDCVDLYLPRGRKLRIGTDDPAGLEAFLRSRVTALTPPVGGDLQLWESEARI